MRWLLSLAATATLGLTSGCVYYEHPRHRVVREEEVVVDRPVEREVIVEDDVRYGPPPVARVEVIPIRPYFGAIWEPGHWWRHHRRHEWVWMPGHWR